MGCWTIQPGDSWVGKACPGAPGWHGQHRGGRQLGLEGCFGFSHTSLIHKRSLALPLGSSKPCHEVGDRQQGSHSFCLMLSKHQQGKQRGWNSAQRKTAQTSIFIFSWTGTSIFPAQLPEQLLPLLPDCAGTETNPGCKAHLAIIRGRGRGDKGNRLPDGAKASSLRWAPRKQPRSEEQLVSWAEKGTSQRLLFYSNTGWSGQGKAWSAQKQKPSAGTKRSKTQILQRGQPAPQEMHSIWPSKSTQSF